MAQEIERHGLKYKIMFITIRNTSFIALLTLFICLSFFNISFAQNCFSVPSVWAPLYDRLVKDGEDPEELSFLFSSVTFDKRVMPRKLKHKEYKAHYEKFLQKSRIARAKRFLARNLILLQEVQDQFGVPKEIMTSIFLIETDLGRYLGAGSAFRILASMALATDFNSVRPWLPQELLGKNEKKTRLKLKKKAEWAYNELRALLKYAKQNSMDILSIKGSIFGAIGLCQFMPSNALRFGIDFDKDNRVDLFSLPDAAASMANYLKHYGWRKGLSREEKVKVILKYNYSRPYANTVLKVASRL